MPTSKQAGRIDLDFARRAYINYLRGVQNGEVDASATGAEPPDLDKYKALLTEEQWRERKRKNDVADGTLVHVDALTDALADVGGQINALLGALPLDLKRSNPSLTNRDMAVIKTAIAKCCQSISEARIAEVGFNAEED